VREHPMVLDHPPVLERPALPDCPPVLAHPAVLERSLVLKHLAGLERPAVIERQAAPEHPVAQEHQTASERSAVHERRRAPEHPAAAEFRDTGRLEDIVYEWQREGAGSGSIQQEASIRSVGSQPRDRLFRGPRVGSTIPAVIKREERFQPVLGGVQRNERNRSVGLRRPRIARPSHVQQNAVAGLPDRQARQGQRLHAYTIIVSGLIVIVELLS
jgi:hypothetical protein